MFQRRTNTFLSVLFIWSQLSCFNLYAAILEPVIIKGTVVSFNKEKVTLRRPNGEKAIVPRNRIPKSFKLIQGANVYAVIQPEKIIQAIKDVTKKL